MSYFEIDAEKCMHDGICVAECPMRILEIKDASLPPSPVEGAEEKCIRCGHCVAVCPHGAFSLEEMKTEDCPPVRNDMALSVEHVEHFLRSRRSIRTYQDKAIEREKLEKLIDIARYAPTGTNSQQVKWLAVNSRDGVRSMAGLVVDLIRHLIAEPSHDGEISLAEVHYSVGGRDRPHQPGSAGACHRPRAERLYAGPD